jgi:hypothetical protein
LWRDTKPDTKTSPLGNEKKPPAFFREAVLIFATVTIFSTDLPRKIYFRRILNRSLERYI